MLLSTEPLWQLYSFKGVFIIDKPQGGGGERGEWKGDHKKNIHWNKSFLQVILKCHNCIFFSMRLSGKEKKIQFFLFLLLPFFCKQKYIFILFLSASPNRICRFRRICILILSHSLFITCQILMFNFYAFFNINKILSSFAVSKSTFL